MRDESYTAHVAGSTSSSIPSTKGASQASGSPSGDVENGADERIAVEVVGFARSAVEVTDDKGEGRADEDAAVEEADEEGGARLTQR